MRKIKGRRKKLYNTKRRKNPEWDFEIPDIKLKAEYNFKNRIWTAFAYIGKANTFIPGLGIISISSPRVPVPNNELERRLVLYNLHNKELGIYDGNSIKVGDLITKTPLAKKWYKEKRLDDLALSSLYGLH